MLVPIHFSDKKKTCTYHEAQRSYLAQARVKEVETLAPTRPYIVEIAVNMCAFIPQ